MKKEQQQGNPKCEFGGLTDVTIYPTCTTQLWRAVAHASPIPGLIDAGWQVTQLTHKQLNTLIQSVQDNLEHIWMNK